jgi:uncharacterized protein YyaL (SSP411 family)
MLYNQALLARTYTEAARITGNPFFADIARSVLDFVSGPLTSGNGVFYTAIDAETDGVEGAYYAWTADEIIKILTPEEGAFFTTFYALADIPAFPGHKHTQGQVIVARKPLDVAARERNIPYAQLAALAGNIMNKLLAVRNGRKAPNLDDKIIVSWNGLMIDAFAHAGRVLANPKYIKTARKAADFVLEHAIDNDGRLGRILEASGARIEATLEDYAFLIKGLLSLYRVQSDEIVLEAIISLTERCGELFSDTAGGYLATASDEYMIARIKSGEDSAIPGANAIMLHNLVDLYEFTQDTRWCELAQKQAGFFLNGNYKLMPELATMLHGALRLNTLMNGKTQQSAAVFDEKTAQSPADATVSVSTAIFPADAGPGEECELMVTLDIKDGWHINANRVNQPSLIPTQLDVQGRDIDLLGVAYPEPLRRGELLVYEGLITITARLHLPAKYKQRPLLRARLRYQPCTGDTCHQVRDISLSV